MPDAVIRLDLPTALRDAGCDGQLAERILALDGERATREELRLLRDQRRKLLTDMHAAQRAIDCLDYVVSVIQTRLSEDEPRA